MPKNGPSEAQVTDQPSTLSPPAQVTMHDPSAIAGGAGCCTVAHAQSTSSRPLTQDFEKIKIILHVFPRLHLRDLDSLHECQCQNVGPDFGVLSLISVAQVCAGPAIPGPAVRLAKYVFSRSAQQNILEYERPRRLSSEKLYEN